MRRPDAIVAVGVLLDECQVLVGSNHRPRVTRQSDYRQRAEHGVDRASLEAELAKVTSGEQRALRP
jgi:hypothetical protein